MSLDGGSAFPSWQSVARPVKGSATAFGMTLRDYFAAHAPVPQVDFETAESLAEWRYRYADAMLAERAK